MLALLGLAALALVGTLLMVTLVAAFTIIAVAAGTVVLLARAFGWRPWRRPAVPAPAPFAGDTIEGTVVRDSQSD